MRGHTLITGCLWADEWCSNWIIFSYRYWNLVVVFPPCRQRTLSTVHPVVLAGVPTGGWRQPPPSKITYNFMSLGWFLTSLWRGRRKGILQLDAAGASWKFLMEEWTPTLPPPCVYRCYSVHKNREINLDCLNSLHRKQHWAKKAGFSPGACKWWLLHLAKTSERWPLNLSVGMWSKIVLYRLCTASPKGIHVSPFYHPTPCRMGDFW